VVVTDNNVSVNYFLCDLAAFDVLYAVDPFDAASGPIVNIVDLHG
jgi:hypothetical protein